MHKSKRPYKLPVPLTCDAEKVEAGISMELVDEYIRIHEERFPRYLYLEALYNGFHDVFKEPEKENWKPDNRLAVNFPRYITETFRGYGYGVPIKVSCTDEAFEEAIGRFEDRNDINDHRSEMVKMCCVYGHAFEFFYQNEESETRVVAEKPVNLFCVYDDTMRRRALFAVRYGYHTDSRGMKQKRYGEILTRDEIIPFEASNKLEAQLNPYGKIPVVEWVLNEERMGVYESVAGLIEAYNHTIGEKANDVDAFAEAYLAVLGAELDEDGIYKIRDNRIINLYGTDDAKDILVQFLQKPTADGTQENLLNRLENLIYQTSMVANISDESFGNATSGTALAYKLQAMSNMALTFDRKIEKSLRKGFKIFCTLSTNTPNKEAWKDIDVVFTRNLPKNRLEEAQTAQAVDGIVSHETQLSLLSFVPDPKEELEKVDGESNERMDAVLSRTYGKERLLDETGSGAPAEADPGREGV